MNSKALEQHLTPAEVAKLWKKSPATIRSIFRDEPGVIKYGNPHSRPGKKRAYVSLSIPASVVERVHNRLSS